jgi:hypothetical protein
MDSTQGSVRARVGDRIVVHGHRVGQPVRHGEVSEVLGEDGAPPFMVRWEDDGHVSRFYPGSDAFVQGQADANQPGA